MNIRLPALLALSLLAFAGTAGALEIDELIAVTAMPLAVADVVALPDVPRDDVITVVTTLNQAAVPAPQFIEIVRYSPVAIVQPAEPRFVTYVTQEYQRGIVGQPLALAIADRYDSYGIDDVDVVSPPVMTVVERQQFLPQVVVTRFQPVEFDPLALIAMPLAVAAVADLADVPRSDLMQLVASLNRAMVPAPQFVEVVRYSPVVLVDRTASPQFLQFVSAEIDRGIIGRPLAFALADRIETFEPIDIDFVEPRLLVERDAVILPAVVTAHIARAHPHGGPPGQLKKELGLQTGAEVVHGTSRPSGVARSRPAKARRDLDDGDRKSRQRAPRVTKERARPREVRSEVRRDSGERKAKAKPRVTRPERGSSGRGNADRGNGGGGKGAGKGKGKGKG